MKTDSGVDEIDASVIGVGLNIGEGGREDAGYELLLTV